jgi:hypothetical protein
MAFDDQASQREVVPEPVETLPVTLLESAVLAARGGDGSIYLSIRDVCQALAISLTSQRRRLQNHPVLREGLTQFRVPTPGGRQVQDFLLLEHVPTWLVDLPAPYRVIGDNAVRAACAAAAERLRAAL